MPTNFFLKNRDPLRNFFFIYKGALREIFFGTKTFSRLNPKKKNKKYFLNYGLLGSYYDEGRNDKRNLEELHIRLYSSYLIV